jgi:hypothetical protein
MTLRSPVTSLVSRTLVGAVALTVGTVGCGTDPGPGGEAAGGHEDAAWAAQVLDSEPNPDSPVLAAADGEHVVVVVVSEDGAITGYAADGDEPFEAGEPTAGGQGFTTLGGIAKTDDGWLVLAGGGQHDGGNGDVERTFEVRAYRSADGSSWSEVETTGLDGPADVSGVVTVPGGVVAVGTLRTADQPSMGGFRPVAWHSADGGRWTAVPLSPASQGGGDPTGSEADGFVQGVAVSGGAVIAVGGSAGRGTVWRSEDSGATWGATSAEEFAARGGDPALGHVAAQGDVVVLSGTARDGVAGGPVQAVWRSTDGGRSWAPAADPPPPGRGEEEMASPVFAGGGRFFLLTTSFIDAFEQAELCYADIELCRQDATVALYASDDGDAWERVDTSGVGAAPGEEGDTGELDALAATDGGRVVGLRPGLGGVGTWAWPAGATLPTMGEPSVPATDVDVVRDDEPLEPGQPSAVPMYIHCGMEWLYAADEAWQRTDDGRGVETGAGDQVPADWPVAQQTIFGYATLVADDRIEYSIGEGDDAEVIATYERSAEEPPGCE